MLLYVAQTDGSPSPVLGAIVADNSDDAPNASMGFPHIESDGTVYAANDTTPLPAGEAPVGMVNFTDGELPCVLLWFGRPSTSFLLFLSTRPHLYEAAGSVQICCFRVRQRPGSRCGGL